MATPRLFRHLLVTGALLAAGPPASAQDGSARGADSEYKTGVALLASGRFTDALRTFQSVLAARQAAGDRDGQSEVLIQIAWSESSLGRNAQALDHGERALALCAGESRAHCEARALAAVGQLHFRQGDSQKALDTLGRALERWEALGSAPGQAEALSEIGWIYWAGGDSAAAIERYERARPLWQSFKNQAGEGYVLNNLGLAYSALGDNPKALEYFEQAVVLRRAAGDIAGEAQSYSNMGWAYWNLAEYQRALDACADAIRLARSVNQKSTHAWALDTRGLALVSLGDYAQGRDAHREALDLRRAIDDRHGLGQTLNNLGAAHFNLGERMRAHRYFVEALAASRAVGDRRREALALNNLGLHALGEKNPRRALDHLRAALAIRRALADRRSEAQTLHNIGRAEIALGSHDVAREHLVSAAKIFQDVGDRASEANTLLALARHAADGGDLHAARSAAQHALEIAESLRTRVASQELRGSYLAARQHYYELSIDVLMRLHRREPGAGYAAAAFELSERARARSLLESLVETHADIRQGVDPDLLARERLARTRLDAAERSRMLLLNRQHTAEQAAAAERELEARLREYHDTQTDIRVRSPRYAALTQPQPLTLAEVQSTVLDERTLLLEYRLGETRSYLWTVTPQAVRGYTLPGRAAIEAAARRLHQLLSEPPRRTARRQLEMAAAQLSAILLAPSARDLAGKRLAIVADGILHYVPFGVLPAPAGANRGCASATAYCPLIVAHEVVTMPSASVLAVIREEKARRPPATKTLAVFSDPVFDPSDPRVGSTRTVGGGASGFQRLPFSRREADAIAAFAPSARTLKATGFDASRESAMRAEIAGYRFVHFATHGLVDSQRPELSGLVLSLVDRTGQPANGFLRSHELYNLSLGADLVVLSACRTALGKAINGEGIVGLARGFMYAGSPRVVASLWDVRDAATAELMAHFYRAMLSEGLPAAAALRSAQLAMWRGGRYAAPFYWAGFILQGEWK